jgi:hypothetical protein
LKKHVLRTEHRPFIRISTAHRSKWRARSTFAPKPLPLAELR